MPRRTRPMLIAPLIPFLAILGIFGVDQFHDSRWLPVLVIVWCLVMAALAVYVGRQAIRARKSKR